MNKYLVININNNWNNWNNWNKLKKTTKNTTKFMCVYLYNILNTAKPQEPTAPKLTIPVAILV